MTKLPTPVDVIAEWAKQYDLPHEVLPSGEREYVGQDKKVLAFYTNFPYSVYTWILSINEFGMVWFKDFSFRKKFREYMNLSDTHVGSVFEAPLYDPGFFENLFRILRG